MAFGNITTLYIPTAANAGSSQWGSDVRKLLDSADAGSDATSKTNQSTGGAVTRTIDPYTTTTTDGTEADYGWAVTPSDMNSVAGARRFFPAGDHVLTARMEQNNILTATGTLFMYVYRVGPAAGRARTLLGSGSSSVALPAGANEVTATVTVTLPEVVFEVDETVQYSFEFNCAGVTIVGRIVTFYTGTTSAIPTQVTTPKLGVLADTTGTASGSAAATGTTGKVLAGAGSSVSTGEAAGVMSATAGTTGAAAGAVAVDGQGSSVAGTMGSATGSSSATGLTSIVLSGVGTAEVGGGGAPTVIRRITRIFED